MSARGNLVLTDRAGSPVAHTFTPDGDDANGVHVFSEKTAVPAGNPRYTAQLVNSNGKYRATLRLQVPVVQTQTLNGINSPVTVRTAYAEVKFTFDQYSSEQERKDIIGMIQDSLSTSKTQINDLLTQLSDIY